MIANRSEGNSEYFLRLHIVVGGPAKAVERPPYNNRNIVLFATAFADY